MRKNKKGEIGLGGIVMIFIGIIVALALVGPIFNAQGQMTKLLPVTGQSTNLATSCMVNLVGDIDFSVNESVAACNITASAWYPVGDWRRLESQCYISSVTVRNATLDFTVDTDYEVFADQGIIRMLNTSGTQTGYANTTIIDYSYCGEGYNKDSSSRTIATLIGLFAVLALMAFSLEWMGVTNFLNR